MDVRVDARGALGALGALGAWLDIVLPLVGSLVVPMKPGATARHRHALAEAATSYGAGEASSHTKLSISLPTDLVAEVRLAAADTGLSVSGVIAAALRGTISGSDQANLDAAIEAQNEENQAWAHAFLPSTSKLWAEIEW